MPKKQGWNTLSQELPIPFSIPWVTGRFYGNPWAIGTSTGAVNGLTLQANPIYIPNVSGVTITSIGLEVTTGGTGSSVRFGIYKNIIDLSLPGELLLDGGTVATATNATYVSVVVSQLLRQGWWWIVQAFATSSGFPTVRTTNGTLSQRLGYSTYDDLNLYQRFSALDNTNQVADIVSNGLPSNFPIFSQAPAAGGALISGARTMVGI